MSGRLCESDSERAWVEAWVIRATMQRAKGEWRSSGGVTVFPAIDEDFNEIDGIRRGKKWERPQIDRLKTKYLARLRPDGELTDATVFELAVEIEKGRRCQTIDGMRQPGTPSLYQPTGILALLEDAAQSHSEAFVTR